MDFSSAKVKMEPLATLKRELICLQMYPTDDAENDKVSNSWKTFNRIVTSVLFVLAVLAMIASSTSSREHMSIDLQRSLLALIPAISFFNAAYIIAATLLLRRKIKRIFLKLSTIYDTSE